MRRKKHSFTLMEVMVGFALISIILGVIFSSLYEGTLLQTKIAQTEKLIMTRVEMQQRLDHLFANIIDDKSSPLKAQKGQLCFWFNNGIDPQLEFCDKIPGTICIEDNHLVLILHEGEPFARRSILRENIFSFSYEFLYIASSGLKKAKEWEQNFLPYYIKITLNKDEQYSFWVNSENQTIVLDTKT